MDYTDYSPEDFLSDESFLNYCFNKNQADVSFWESWIRNHPEKLGVFNEARETCFKLSIRLSPEEKEREWKKLQASVYTANTMEETGGYEGAGKQERGKSPVHRLLPVMAALAAVGIFIFGIKVFNESFELRHRKQVTNYTAYTTGIGERRTVTLPDGTNILLNANSRMDVPADYNQGQRDILLKKGDGFFEVAQDHLQPFRVTVNGIVTTALGTSFRVRAYPFEKNIKVMLLTGKVEIASQLKNGAPVPVYLIPGEEATLNKGGGAIQKGSFDISQMDNWKAGRLIFKDATLREMAEELQNWYGVKVTITGNTSKKIHFNGEFDKDKDIRSVMKAIAFINGMEYDLEGDVLTLMVE